MIYVLQVKTKHAHIPHFCAINAIKHLFQKTVFFTISSKEKKPVLDSQLGVLQMVTVIL